MFSIAHWMVTHSICIWQQSDVAAKISLIVSQQHARHVLNRAIERELYKQQPSPQLETANHGDLYM